jgi:hypothetical protein
LRAYAVVNRHTMGDRAPYVLVTDDGGSHWRVIAGGLPSNEPAHVIREDPRNPEVLYAGLEQGTWVTFDRGARWEPLKLDMPAVSVHDLRVQPAANDLIAGTHGRGLYILDDLTPLQQLTQARAAGRPALFQPRTAYTWYVWWEGQYGTHDDECCVPAGVFSGTDAPYGAILSYYLPHAVSGASIEIDDSAGKRVRKLDVDANAGIGRTSWDLLEDPIVAWNAAREWNRTWDAPMVVPGTYNAVLHAGSQVVAQKLVVQPDPRAHWTQEQYVARHDFLAELDGELSQVDAALNDLDARRAHAAGSARHGIDRVYALFSSGIVNSEDDQWKPDSLRERLTILLGVVNLSQGPPLPPHLREAAEIKAEFERAMAAYHALTQEHIE